MHHIVRWVRLTGTGSDHLAIPTDNYMPGRARVSWCGFNLDSKHAAPAGSRRCRDCVRILEKFTAEATAPVPETVTEVVTVHITRPSKARETGQEAVLRRMRAMTSWEISVETPGGQGE